MKIPEFEEANPFAEKTYHKILKSIFKYSKQQSTQVSLLSIMSPMGETFQFSCVSVDNVFKEKKSVHVKLPTVMDSCKDSKTKWRVEIFTERRVENSQKRKLRPRYSDKKYWKSMDQSLFLIKTFNQTLKLECLR